MKKTLKSLMILSMAGLLAACGDKGNSSVINPNDSSSIDESISGSITGDYLVKEPTGRVYGIDGLRAKKQYKTLIYFSNAVPNLNYMETSEAADAQHFANFVDGLLTHNEYGVLVKNLAEEVTHNEDYTKFEFQIKRDVPWVTYDGAIYEAVEDGVKAKQYVKPSDWLSSAKAILTAQNASGLEYLLSDFIKGGAEYYYWTELAYAMATDATAKKQYSTTAKQAAYINKQIKENKENLWNVWYEENPVTADDIDAIKNMSRLGIKADDEAYTLTYELIQGAFYFPTLLTYSCYLPVNQYFLKDVGFTSFGTKNDKILYCGPFTLTKEGDDELIYTRNAKYFDQSIINVDEIIYMVYDNTIGNDWTRVQYFEGNIDGFGLSTEDAVGWKQFVTGEDLSGDVYNPVFGDVNARLLDTIGSMYGSNISMARSKRAASKVSYSTKGTSQTVANTEKALTLEPVRRAILNALDYDTYYQNYGTQEPFKSQYKVNTYVPKNFVQSETGDYVTTHYYAEYARQKGIATGTKVGDGAHLNDDGEIVAEPGSAAYILENGRIDRCGKTDEEVGVLADNARKAIQAYNAMPEHASSPITLPVQIEFYTPWDVDTTGAARKYDGATILSMNKRLNKTDSENVSEYDLFYVVPTDACTSSNMDTMSHNGAFDYSAVLWGWGADYGDPLSYMNTYTIGGDWKSIFPFVGEADVENYFMDDAGQLTRTNLLEEYTSVVKAGAAITEDINARYNKFAEAEYMLMEELSIYMPQINYGQGWSLSISKAAGYHMPTSNYGLSGDRMTGLWVLEQALTREERNAVRAKQEAAKAAYVKEHSTIDIY